MSFFSIMMFVALSVGIFTGISWTGPALQKASERVFDENGLHDYEIQFPYGLTDEDLEELEAVDGIDEAETGKASFQIIERNGREYVIKVMSLMTEIDRPVVTEGMLPQRPDEIALNTDWAKKQKLKLGDTIVFRHDDEKDEKDGMEYLNGDTYTLTALVDNPAYIALHNASLGFSNIGSGYVQGLAYLAPSAFDAEAYAGYPLVYLRSDRLRGLATAGKAYGESSGRIKQELTELGSTLSAARCKALRDEAQAKIDEAKKSLAEGKKQIENGEKQIADGEKQLEEAKAQVADGEKQLAAGKAEAAAGEKKLKDGLAKLQSGQAAYAEQKALYDRSVAQADAVGAVIAAVEQANSDVGTGDGGEEIGDGTGSEGQGDESSGSGTGGEGQSGGTGSEGEGGGTGGSEDTGLTDDTEINLYDYGVTEEQITEFEKQLGLGDDFVKEGVVTYGGVKSAYQQVRQKLDEAAAQLASYESQLKKGWNDYYAGLKKLEAGRKQIADGEKRLASAKEEIASNEKLLEQKKTELADAKKEYEENDKKIADQQKQLDGMKTYEWSVLDRSNNGGVQIMTQFSDITDNLRYSMALLFVIIGLLVSYSAISRIVRDQLVSVGTKKALGLRGSEITLSYLAYSGVAVLAGSLLGLLCGVFGIEPFLARILGARFIMGNYAPYFSLPQALLITTVELVMILATSWLACRKLLKQHAIELLKGVKPPSGKPRFFESWGLWERLPLFSKTVINNCLNDKRRVLATVIGVAGCTALMVTAVTVNDNVQSSFTRQYETVYGYDTVVRFHFSEKGVEAAIDEKLKQIGAEGTPAYVSAFALEQPDGRQDVVAVTVPFDEENFDRFFHREAVGGAEAAPLGDGVWMSVAYASHMGAKVGDEVEIMDSGGQRYHFQIDGFFSHYLINHQMILSRAAYKQVFGEEAKANVILTDSGGKGTSEVKKALKGLKGIRQVKNDYQSSRNMFDEFSQITSAVITIYLILSVLMAVVVLLDLNAVFIEEKKRELIVLMINGFSVGKAKKYIYQDMIVLTVIGILLGVVLGTLMGNVTILSIEPENASFIKGIDWFACGVGALSSAVLSAVMSIIALRRIPRFSLTDINKM